MMWTYIRSVSNGTLLECEQERALAILRRALASCRPRAPGPPEASGPGGARPGRGHGPRGSRACSPSERRRWEGKQANF